MFVVSIFVSQRFKEVNKLQDIFTFYGDKIKTRLGIHDIGPNKEGVILVLYTGENIENFIEELKKNQKVIVNYMKIC